MFCAHLGRGLASSPCPVTALGSGRCGRTGAAAPARQFLVLPILLLGEDTAAFFNMPGIPEVPRRLQLISVKF